MLFFVLCFVALYALVFSVGKGITSVVNVVGAAAYAETFSTDMASGNYQGAHDTLGSNLANRYSVNTLQSKWEALVGANTFDSGTMGSPRTSGDNIIIPWTINGANGKTYNVDLYVSNVSSSADFAQDSGREARFDSHRLRPRCIYGQEIVENETSDRTDPAAIPGCTPGYRAGYCALCR